MGVPAFFAWLAKKYPKIVSPVLEEEYSFDNEDELSTAYIKANENGELDNLYLDMNGLIHPSTHPEDRPPPETEEEMIQEVLRYTERMILMAKPRNLIYLAIDGVAPKAKLKQQRSRRFRSAQESYQSNLKNATSEVSFQLNKDGKIVKSDGISEEQIATPDEKSSEAGIVNGRWDSNAITPGTQFMHKLAICLRYWVTYKLSSDPAWKDLKIILSDSNVPGEGEHKIMNFIRNQRKDPSYNNNTSHCVYGLDADLVFLALASHEPHFKILREDVFLHTVEGSKKFNKAKKPENMDKLDDSEKAELIKKSSKKPFLWLHLSVLREYLSIELNPGSLNNLFDLERAIDDWIFMCFFCGNDFLPHLPSLSIREQGLELLLNEWKLLQKTQGQYLTRNGNINFHLLEKFLMGLAKKEPQILKKSALEAKSRAEYFKKSIQSKAESAWNLHKSQYVRDQNLNSEEMAVTNDEGYDEYKPANKLQKTEQVDVVEAMRKKTAGVKSVNMEKMKFIKLETQKLLAERFYDLPPSAEEGNVFDSHKLVEFDRPGYEERYYKNKFFSRSEIDNMSEEALKAAIDEKKQSVAREYLKGVSWVLKYYYDYCASWDWSYPYNHGPLLVDFRDTVKLVEDHVLEISAKKLSKQYTTFKHKESYPILPYEQLMSVMPSSSGHTLPDKISAMMTDKNSGVVEYFPKDFPIDMAGANMSWLGIPILPDVDTKHLVKTLNKVYPSLTTKEVDMNVHKNSIIMTNKNSSFAKNANNILKKTVSTKVTNSDPKKFKVATRCNNSGINGSLWYLLDVYKRNANRLSTVVKNDVFHPDSPEKSETVELMESCFLNKKYGSKVKLNDVLWLGYDDNPKDLMESGRNNLLPNFKPNVPVLNKRDTDDLHEKKRQSAYNSHNYGMQRNRMTDRGLEDFLKHTMSNNLVDSGKYTATPYTNKYGGFKSFVQKNVGSRMPVKGPPPKSTNFGKNAANSFGKVSRFAK